MNIWILTIGSSDVQLKNKTNWKKLFDSGRSQLKPDRGFNPSDGNEGRFQVPARVLGVVYSQPQAEQHFDDLVFPLIDNFLSKIKDQPIHKIILILGDQSIFQLAERSSQHHAYWQDTCTLQPLLEKYLKQKLQESSPDLQFHSLFLRPTSSTEGLDDWNAVLKLVQNKFSSLDFPDDAKIYVSHQAGTPAISSAVQFTSLSRFGEQVKFLVSNERDAKLTRILPSSEYLKGIRKKEAETLLSRHDYSGVKDLVFKHLSDHDRILLKAAIQWNFAEFNEFKKELRKDNNLRKKCPDLISLIEERTKEENWWWTAYEAAYLGVVRLKQKNTVEAMFHTFRAVEGLIYNWICQLLKDQRLEQRQDGQIQLPRKIKIQTRKGEKELDCANFYGIGLYYILDSVKCIDREQDKDIYIFGNSIFDRRNKLFHKLQGLEEQEAVFEQWDSSEQKEWEKRVINCLNYIAQDDLSEEIKKYIFLEDASLMFQVHKKLVEAIVSL